MEQSLLKETSDYTDYTKEEAENEIWNNFGFKELKILDGSIGYLNLSVFFSTDYAREIAYISMKYFKNCKALIIDLRQNGGGWGDMVINLLSYFIDNKKPLLLDITKSTLDGTTDSTIVPMNVKSNKLINIPIYILVSTVTASAAEAFTFYIKHLNKYVTLVGKKNQRCRKSCRTYCIK